MMPMLPQTFSPDPNAIPYEVAPRSVYRVKLDFRVEFTNGGGVEGKDFLLDIPGPTLSLARAAEIVVSSMNLLRAGPVTILSMQVVRRGEHDDLIEEHAVTSDQNRTSQCLQR